VKDDQIILPDEMDLAKITAGKTAPIHINARSLAILQTYRFRSALFAQKALFIYNSEVVLSHFRCFF